MVEDDVETTQPSADGPDPLVGKVLHGRFTILERVGEGGMGRVYKALQAPLDRVVALKVLDSKYASGKDPGFQKRFFLEASLTSKLRHPNTITVIDYGRTADGIYYIAMEFVEGLTLAALLATERCLPWQRCLHIGQQVCRSLREAHKLGVVHRDLKPANVMILNEETDQDLVKVLDFGLVKPFSRKSLFQQTTEITQHGMLIGSPLYMAPEQAKSDADPRSDIYALGVVLYEMLTGEPPFSGQSIDVIVKHINDAPAPPHQRRPDLDIPDEVEALVLRCLEKDPARRFQSMEELLDGMRAAGGSNGYTTGLSSRPRYVPADELLNQVPSHAIDLQNASTDDPAVSGRRAMREGRGASERRASWPIALFLISALLGAGVILGVARHRKQNRVPPPPPAEVARAPKPITFRLQTDPSGASVQLDGRLAGTTPLSFERLPGPDGTAQAAVTFSLPGYQPLTVTAGGSGPEVVMTQKLEPELVELPAARPPPKRAPKPTPKPKAKPSPDYKEDPYQ